MKQLFYKVFSLQSLVLKLILLMTVGCGLWTDAIAQNNIYATGGRTKVLEWKSAGDYSDYTLLFVAVDSDDDRVLEKTLSKTYSTGYTTMQCTLFVSDTEDLTADASYNYDIVAYGADTITVRSGVFNLIDPVQTSFNGTNLPGDGSRFYIAGTFVDTTVTDGSFFTWDSTTQTLTPISKDSVWQFLNVGDTVITKIMETVEDTFLTASQVSGIIDSTVDAGLQELSLNLDSLMSNNVLYVGSRDGYTSIQSAITASVSGDVIKILKGTYTEQITVSKSLTFDLQDNAILDYTTASTGATVIINSGITAKFIGGEIKRTSNTSSSKVIQNAGNLILKDVAITHSGSTQYIYHIYSTNGTIEADNINYENPYYYGGTYLNSTDGNINAKNFLGFINFDSSRVTINSDNWFQKWNGFNRSDITGNSIVSFSIKHQMGKLPQSGNLDSLYNGYSNLWVIYTYDNAEITFRDGLFTLLIYPYGSNKINLLSVHNESGAPSVRSFPVTNTTQYWTVQNSTFNHIPALWENYKEGGAGQHIFEHTGSATNYLYLDIDNCNFNFGDPDYANRDSVRISGNWMQVVDFGRVMVRNSTVNEYANKGYSLAYQPFNYLGRDGLKYYLYNNNITIHGSGKFLGYVPIYSGQTIDTRIIDNTIILKDNSSTNNYILQVAATRELTSNDTLIVSGNTYSSDYGNPSLFYCADFTYFDYSELDSLYLNQNTKSQFNYIEANALYTKGFAYYVQEQNNILNSWGTYLELADTLSRSGVNGDSLRIRFYFTNDKKKLSGSLNGNQTDADFTIYGHKANSNSQNNNSVYDVRFASLNLLGTSASNRDYYLGVDSVFNAQYYPCWLKFTFGTISLANATNTTDDYMDLYINNLNAFGIEVGVWLKQSLNIRKIEVLRF